MLKFGIFAVFNLILCVSAKYNGPFLLWGIEGLNTVKPTGLESIDDQVLRDLFSEASAIIVFVRNSSVKLSAENYPSVKSLTSKTPWAYVTQKWLSADPNNYNVNTEIVQLVGPATQQDTELSALYRDAVLNFGEGKVLGILATKWNQHLIEKRAVLKNMHEALANKVNAIKNISTNPLAEDDNTYTNGLVYAYPGKSMLYTSSAPILKIMNPTTNETDTILLESHLTPTSDTRENYNRLSIRYQTDSNNTITLRFIFPLSGGYWSLASVDVEDVNNKAVSSLNVVGEAPTAPIGFSYMCGQKLFFRNETLGMDLILETIQVQTEMMNKTIFGDAFDCVGFTTAPIWSGIFVSFIMLFGASIGMAAILDIKPPNRFENSRSKQLTFTVQE